MFGALEIRGVPRLPLHVSVLQRILGGEPVTASPWGLVIGAAITILVVMESDTLVRRFVERRP